MLNMRAYDPTGNVMTLWTQVPAGIWSGAPRQRHEMQRHADDGSTTDL